MSHNTPQDKKDRKHSYKVKSEPELRTETGSGSKRVDTPPT